MISLFVQTLCSVPVCHSETDDSSSLPVAERTEVNSSPRKPSLHLTLPDFQDASTGGSTGFTHFYHRLVVQNYFFFGGVRLIILIQLRGVTIAALTASVSQWTIAVPCFLVSRRKMDTMYRTFFPSPYTLTQQKIIFGDLVFTWKGADIFVSLVVSAHRFTEPVVSGGFSPGGGALRGVGLKLRPTPRADLHLDHPGTHMAAGWYITLPHTIGTFPSSVSHR